MAAIKSPNQSTKLLGEVLVKMGLINHQLLENALAESQAASVRLGQYLVDHSYITEMELARAIAEQYQLEYNNLKGLQADFSALEKIPETIAKTHKLLPISFKNGVLHIATNDPFGSFQLNQMDTKLGVKTSVEISPFSELEACLDSFYLKYNHSKKEAKENASRAEEDTTSKTLDFFDSIKNLTTEKKGNIEEIVNKIINRGISHQASDIHIEPQDDSLLVRERIDGVLEKSFELNLDFASGIVSRTKILAELDISERRLPQDGRFLHKFHDILADIRVSTLPTLRGEKLVLRILNKTAVDFDFGHMGMDPEMEKSVKQLIEKPYGLILVTGPTGSGKTTSVYSMLNHLNSSKKNIISIEDPVEYQFDLINQVQVNSKFGISFEKVLRNVLRQDPDIIMVGEIRDHETAELAIRAALTGHLVISTIHTNDSLTSINRLLDIGIDPFLISSSLVGVLSQRLVRKLCPSCKIKVDELPEDANPIMQEVFSEAGEAFEANGCENCFDTGFSGREGIFELFIPNREIKKAISQGKSSEEISTLVENFKSMLENGKEKVAEGITSISEILRSTT